MNASQVIDAVEELVINAGHGIPIRTANSPEGLWIIPGVDRYVDCAPLLEEMPVDGSGSWAHVSMPNLTSRQFTSGTTGALRGSPRSSPLVYIRYFCPVGSGVSSAVEAVEAIAAVLESQKIEDALGGVQLEEGVTVRQLGNGPEATGSNQLYFQVEGVIHGICLWRKAAA